MLLEALVIGACVGGYECNQAPRAYYLSKPELRTWVKEKAKAYKEKLRDRPVAQVVVPTLLGTVFLMSGGKPRIRVTDNIAFRVSQEETEITFTYVF